MALAGKTAVIESVEQDLEERILLALVARDAAGFDMGMMRQPGHRFFSPDEIEPLDDDEES